MLVKLCWLLATHNSLQHIIHYAISHFHKHTDLPEALSPMLTSRFADTTRCNVSVSIAKHPIASRVSSVFAR